MYKRTLIGLLLVMGSSPVRAQWFNLDKALWEPTRKPPFAQYSVPLTFTGQPAPVDLRSNPKAQTFRTVLRTSAKNGPNFADAFTIIYWGCGGTDCATLAIVDARTGRVYFAPFTVTCELGFERNSRLLSVDSPTCFLDEQTEPGARVQRWYVWDGRSLVLQDSTRMRPTQRR